MSHVLPLLLATIVTESVAFGSLSAGLAAPSDLRAARSMAHAQSTDRSVRQQRPGGVQHGATNPTLYPMLVGLWTGTWCDLPVASLRVITTNNVLSGALSSRPVVMKDRVTACKDLQPSVDGEFSDLTLSTLGFD